MFNYALSISIDNIYKHRVDSEIESLILLVIGHNTETNTVITIIKKKYINKLLVLNKYFFPSKCVKKFDLQIDYFFFKFNKIEN